jgi:15-hydroxyprostaglandin dehydrogenase (NAD)
MGHYPKIVLTFIAAVLYHMPPRPIYAASIYALVGHTRSAAPVLGKENIMLNAMCPAFVLTNIVPLEIREYFLKEHITPMSTVIKAYQAFLDGWSMYGQVAECNLDQIY